MKPFRFASAFWNGIFRARAFKVSQRFKEIYEKNLFGGEESRSGPGSSLVQTEHLRLELPRLIEDFGITSFLDAPCGDCNWIATLDWGKISYTGVDVVSELICANQVRLEKRNMQFIVADLCEASLPRADLIFCRDCWVHLPFPQIRACLENFRRSGASYLVATTFPATKLNRDLEPGAIWRTLNLQKPPFCFPAPERLLVENCTENHGVHSDKALALWKLQKLEISI